MTTVILPVLGEALPIVALIAAVVLLGGPCDRVLSRWADAARREVKR